MKGINVFAVVALTVAFVSVAAAQGNIAPANLLEEEARTIPLHTRPEIHHIDLSDDFNPASGANPYIYLQTMCLRWSDDGTAFFSYIPFQATIGGQSIVRTLGDDVVLMSGRPVDPPYSTSSQPPIACVSQITFAIAGVNPLVNNTQPGTLALRVILYPWDGAFGSAAGATPIATGTATINFAAGTTSAIFLVTLSATNLQVPKAFWVAFEVISAQTSNINLANVGPLISNSTPGSVSMLPGRGYFRGTTPTTPVFTNLTGGSVFVGLPQGSFYLALRGTHNFVGRIDMSALSSSAQPQNPLFFEFETAADVEKALRRNLVDVEVVNDSGAQPFTSRFTTYLDEKGQFTLPVSLNVQSITIRRWDNGLSVRFERDQDGPWSLDPCSPTTVSKTMVFGDVNGDGTINDLDLLAVLLNFGQSG
ncbi:MAG: hypothetical protein NZ874_03040 [Fimbriimonadales bacterium]|nr:hypothetical protein [Fimbriimonadales bacterium]